MPSSPTAAVFSIFNAVLLRPLPFPHADRLVLVYDTQPACKTCPASRRLTRILVLSKIQAMLAAAQPGVLAAIASPRRREILRLVWNGERTAGAIHREMPDVTFGAVSLQLRALERAGLVESRPEKQFRY